MKRFDRLHSTDGYSLKIWLCFKNCPQDSQLIVANQYTLISPLCLQKNPLRTHPKSLFTPGLKCFSLWPTILVFRGHLLVFNSYNTISMLCFYVAPPSGISSIKAILMCPGYFQMALGVLLSSPSASLALSPFTFSCFLSSPHMKVPSADLCLAGFILSSSENIKVSKSISWGSSSINGIHSFLICAAKLI